MGKAETLRMRAFTLVECIAIIAILATCGILTKVALSYRTDSIKLNIAKQELALLNCAIEAYKSKTGNYPIAKSTSYVENAATLYSSLSQILTNLSGSHVWTLEDGKLVDPWGNYYFYKCDGPDSVVYVLFSFGPNGHIDEGELIDDIYSR